MNPLRFMQFKKRKTNSKFQPFNTATNSILNRAHNPCFKPENQYQNITTNQEQILTPLTYIWALKRQDDGKKGNLETATQLQLPTPKIQ